MWVSRRTIPPATTVVRIGRNHDIGAYDTSGDWDYNSQSNAAPNRTFTKIAWTSNFDVTPTESCTTNAANCNYYNMYTELGSGSSGIHKFRQCHAKSGDSGATGYPDGYGRENWQLGSDRQYQLFEWGRLSRAGFTGQ